MLRAAVTAALLAAGCSPPAAPPNIVLVVIDTLRADHLSCYGYSRPTTPRIDALAARGTLFEDASATAAYTRASTASILTGVYPSVHGAVAHADAISPRVPTLAEKLRVAGYRTAGIIRNGNVRPRFGFGRGFESYVLPDDRFWALREEAGEGEVTRWRDVDDRLLAAPAVRYLEDAESPFFLYLHLADPHDPYTPPPDFRPFVDGPLTEVTARFYEQAQKQPGQPAVLDQIRQGLLPSDEATRRQVVALYDSEIAHSDRQLGVVLDALADNGLEENTVVVVTSDHGEELWDHGGLNHGHSHFRELLRVPLVAAGPGIEAQRLAQPVSLVDLMPTLLGLAGLVPGADLPGRSLLSALGGRGVGGEAPIYAEGLLRLVNDVDPVFFRSVQRGRLKLILDFQRQRKLLFDLGSDPGETTDLLDQRTGAGRQLLEELLAVHGDNLDSPYLAPVAPVDVPEDVAAELRALGYLGGESDSAATSSLFRRPLRLFDLASHGLLGHEVEGGKYRSQYSFQVPDLSPEQLLYGWQPEGDRGRMIQRRAGIRLRREERHRRWRLRGVVPWSRRLARPLKLDVRIDGGEPQSRLVEEVGHFDLSGPLPEGARSLVRFDVECSVESFAADGERTDEYARCVRVLFFGLV